MASEHDELLFMSPQVFKNAMVTAVEFENVLGMGDVDKLREEVVYYDAATHRAGRVWEIAEVR